MLPPRPLTAGELFQTPETPGIHTPMKVALEIQTAALPLLHWLGPRMVPDKDRLLLVRPYGLEKGTGKEPPQTQRLMAAFHNEAQNYR